MKKILFTICFFVIFPGLTTFAYNDSVEEIVGFVADIDGDIIHIMGEPLTSNGLYEAYIFLDNAPIYDLRTGLRVPAENIKKDMDIRAAYQINEDFINAVVIWLNWDFDDAAVFTVTVSENINNCTDGVVFLSTDGRYRVSLTTETIIQDPGHGFIYPEDILPGMELFVWVDTVTASTPALVFPDKVVLVS